MQPALEGNLVGGRYRLRRLLGRGGMGEVYEAWQEDLGRAVAVKLLRPTEGGLDPVTLDRFQREARAVAALGSLHIVQIHDFQAQPGQEPFLVMELLAGRTLAEAIKAEGSLAPARVARIGVHVLSALDAAHRSGILHRDIKPANVFLTQTPTLGEIAKVLDFGIAKIASSQKLTQAGSLIGTVSYMSPEQTTGAELDPRSDVYSLSLSLYAALAGKNPFSGLSMQEAIPRIVAGRVPSLAELRPDVDGHLARTIAAGMAADRERRFLDAAAMASALELWLASAAARPSLAPPSVMTAPARLPPDPPTASVQRTAMSVPAVAPPARKSSALWLAVVAVLGFLLLGLLVLGGVALFFGRDLVGSVMGESSAAPVSASAAPPTAAPSSAAMPEPGEVSTGRSVAAASRPKSSAQSSASSSPPTPAPPPGAKSCTTSTGAGCTFGEECVSGKCVCQSAYTNCGGECVNLKLNGDNCGGCGKACSTTQYCDWGACRSCEPPRARCGGACVSLNSDFNNCGACGKKCLPPSLCVQGECKKPVMK